MSPLEQQFLNLGEGSNHLASDCREGQKKISHDPEDPNHSFWFGTVAIDGLV